MKTRLCTVALVPLVLALLVLSGCLQQVCVWSPDGKRAAVINLGKDQFFLSDAEGRLSPVPVSGVSRVAWLSDSLQLVLVREHAEAAWTPVARALGQQRAEQLAAQGDAAWQKLQAGGRWTGDQGVAGLFSGRDSDWNLVNLYLRERHGDALKAKLNVHEWSEVAARTAKIQGLVMARLDGEKLVLSRELYEGVDDLCEVRVSPDDKVVAWVAETEQGKSKDNHLWAMHVEGTVPVLVAERVAGYPDWSPDSRSLVYIQSSGTSSSDDLQLGTLVQRDVVDSAGRLEGNVTPKYLAGLIFSELSRVRCLRDGRVLFNAAEIHLPMAADDYGEQREQFFAVDPARQSTLVRMVLRRQEENLPKTLAFFEVSPDEKQVLFGDIKGNVCLLTLATGAVQRIQDGAEGVWQGEPSWRKAGEFTYTRRTPQKNGQKPTRIAEIVLRNGDRETVLSQSWPDALVNSLYSASK